MLDMTRISCNNFVEQLFNEIIAFSFTGSADENRKVNNPVEGYNYGNF